MTSRRHETPFDTYLREIQAYPLLTPQEERELGRRVQAASPANEAWGARRRAAEASPLDALQHMVEEQRAQEARFELTVRNLRLVVSEAKRWARRGLQLADLVAEGNVGLYHAVELFDPGRGVRFSTYATWWIRQAIRRALVNTVRTVRIPRHMSQELARWRDWSRRFEQREGRAPDPDEVARAMPGSAGRRRILARVFASVGRTGRTVSLNTLFEEDPRLPDARSPVPGESPVEAADLDRLRAALAGLEAREAQVVRLRYGLDAGAKPMTLRDVGTALGVSRERARQLEQKALARLRGRLGPA